MTDSFTVLHLELAPTDAVGTVWHAELGRGGADLGRIRVGPTAFAHRVGMLLGHPLAVAPPGERVAAAVRILAALDDGGQWFSATREADPLGAALWMVQAHDALRNLGWDGSAVVSSPRLAALFALRRGAGGVFLPPGLPDVLHGLVEILARRAPSVRFDVHLGVGRAFFSPLMRALLSSLEARDHRVVEAPTLGPCAPADSDLGRLQRALLGGAAATLAGDGTLRILQGETPWEAAALATALLDDRATWLVSGDEAVLDCVRSRFDRPRLAGGAASRWRPALQVLPLALALQVGPQDPQTALELLTLPVCPVPGAVRRGLISALGDQPAIGSPRWSEALAQGLEKHAGRYPDADIDTIANRIGLLFPVDPPRSVPASELLIVVEAVTAWARHRGARDGDALLLAASSVGSDLTRSLRQLPADHPLDRLQIGQFHDLAVGDGLGTGLEAEQGAPSVARAPETVCPGTSDLVWYGLVAGNAEAGRPIDWTDAERDGLAEAGADLPPDGALREQEQHAWLQAVLAPSVSLSLVTWESAGAEASEPHPLLDLWATRLRGDGLRGIVTTAASVLSRPDGELAAPVAFAAEVTPRGAWRVLPGAIATKRTWSASSIEKLITCPLSWVLAYAANLRPGTTAALPDLRSLAGTFGHALFATLLFEDSPGWAALTPETARERLHALFDARVATEAAPLTLPAQRAYAGRLRRQLGEAIAALVDRLKAGGWRPEAAERSIGELGGTFAGQPLAGSIDLLVHRDDGRRGVVDLKLGGGGYRRGSLKKGTSVQLAVYARAASAGASPVPPVAYFILEDGELISTDSSAFPGAGVVDGPGPAETLLDAERAWRWWGAAVRGGLVIARGEHLETEDVAGELTDVAGGEPPDHPWAREEPSCRFCDARRLCTFSLEGGAA